MSSCIRCGTTTSSYRCNKCSKIVKIEEQKFLFPLSVEQVKLIENEHKSKKEDLEIKNIYSRTSDNNLSEKKTYDSFLDFMKNNEKKEPFQDVNLIQSVDKNRNSVSDNISRCDETTNNNRKTSPNQKEPARTSSPHNETNVATDISINNNDIKLSLKKKRIIGLLFLLISLVAGVYIVFAPWNNGSYTVGILFGAISPLLLILGYCFHESENDEYNFCKMILCSMPILSVVLQYKDVWYLDTALFISFYGLICTLFMMLVSYLEHGKKSLKSSYISGGLIVLTLIIEFIISILK